MISTIRAREPMNKIGRLAAVVFFALPIVGCASYSPEARHEGFKNLYGYQVGKKVEDSWLARYPESVVGSRVLPNGHTEIEFRPTTIRPGGCRVFYDTEAGVIVGWRFEGSEEDCGIVP